MNCINVREYHGMFPHFYHITFLVAAVSAHYLCSLPSLTYLTSIGCLLLAAAAAYSWDCDPWIITHMTLIAHIQLVVCLIYKQLHTATLRDSLGKSLWVETLWAETL